MNMIWKIIGIIDHHKGMKYTSQVLTGSFAIKGTCLKIINQYNKLPYIN